MAARSELLRRAYAVESPDEVRDLYRDWAKFYDADLLGEGIRSNVLTLRVA
jgi:hypothetical protein